MLVVYEHINADMSLFKHLQYNIIIIQHSISSILHYKETREGYSPRRVRGFRL